MIKRCLLAGVLFCLVLPLLALAQDQPPVYTYISSWSVPRQQWDEFAKSADQNIRPVLERRTTDGTLVGWGIKAADVHDENGTTHAVEWSSTSIAGIEKVRAELLKAPPNPAMFNAKHHDLLFHSLVYQSRPTKPTVGFQWVGVVMVQPGKGQQWLEWWEKYDKAIYDALLADGTLSFYEIMVEHVHTTDPDMRYIVYGGPNADLLDKVSAADEAANAKRTPEERRTRAGALTAVSFRNAHRDSYFSFTSHSQK